MYDGIVGSSYRRVSHSEADVIYSSYKTSLKCVDEVARTEVFYCLQFTTWIRTSSGPLTRSFFRRRKALEELKRESVTSTNMS